MRKNLRKFVTAALASALVLGCAACGSDAGSNDASVDTVAESNAEGSTTEASEDVSEDTAPETDSAEAPDADAYVNVVGSEPNVVDVVRFTGIADRTVFYNVLEPLIRIENGELVGAGAETWEVSEDGLTYTFYLRENHWSDGIEVTAGDYAEALYRQADPDNAYAFASDIYCIENFEAAFLGEADPSDIGVEVPDDKTLILHLSEASPALLSTFEFYPERADYVEEYGDQLGTEAESVISCGPFTLDTWVHNSELTFSKNEAYWDAENVHLTGFAFEIITDSAAQFNSFQAGEIDYLSVTSQDYINVLDTTEGLVRTDTEGARTFMFVMNGKDSVFQNEKVRLAFSLAIAREDVVNDLYNGLGTPAYGLVPAACGVASYHYRDEIEEPLRALASEDPVSLLTEGLSELGLSTDPADLTVTLSFGATTATMKTYGEYYQQMWQNALGVVIELEFNDSTTQLANTRSGAYQIALTSWGANLEPQFQLTRFVGGGQTQAANAQFDEITNQAVATIDDAQRLALYGEAEKVLINTAMIAPLYYSGSVRYAYDYVRGLTENSFDTVGMKNVYTVGRQ